MGKVPLIWPIRTSKNDEDTPISLHMRLLPHNPVAIKVFLIKEA